MASAQVGRKLGHLEAGKKRLEEFRRKKASEKAKKTAATSDFLVSDVISNDKHPSVEEIVSPADSNVVGNFKDDVFVMNKAQESDLAYDGDHNSFRDTSIELSALPNNDGSRSFPEHSHLFGVENNSENSTLNLDKHGNPNFISSNSMDGNRSSTRVPSGIGDDHVSVHHLSSDKGTFHASNQFNNKGSYHYPSNNNNNHEKDPLLGNSGQSSDFSHGHSNRNSIKALISDKLDRSIHHGKILTPPLYQGSSASTTNGNNPLSKFEPKISDFSEFEETKPNGFPSHKGLVDISPPAPADSIYGDFNSNAKHLSHQMPLLESISGKRSRPSFLDDIQISKGSSSPAPLIRDSKVDYSSSKVYPMDSMVPPFSHQSFNSSIASDDGVEHFNHVREKDFLSRKQNEDFAALEQHIEDLTQEKFSLQRALETSRTLTESLASENSTLTENFNHQGSIVNQLKNDLGKLQEEIRAQLVNLESVKIEYANAQLECNAADERAKLLASEVIGLEEKALRLRSNELKLERQLENSEAEASSCRRKLSSLEKDRQDLLSTVNALQEEKKLLQSKLRQASSGKSTEAKQIANIKKDVSTSTEDLHVDFLAELPNTSNYAYSDLREDEVHASQFPDENMFPSSTAVPLVIPSDQRTVIQNINQLINELALEKDQLLKDLSAESSKSSKLLDLNNELTRKLESQTQRLELLALQRRASDIVQPKSDTFATGGNPTYADEGDEVVERVLGWIMNLFPGGTSKRQTSKQF